MVEKYKYDWLVVGAGLFGAVFANLMKEHGKKVLVIDKKDHVGGMCYIKNRYNIPVHVYGPHVFHTNDEDIWKYVNKFASFNRFTYMPVAHYEYDECNINKMYTLPVNLTTYNELLGAMSPSAGQVMVDREIHEAKLAGSPDNLEQKLISSLGTSAYRYIYKHYIKKVYGKYPSDMEVDSLPDVKPSFSWNTTYYKDDYQGVADYTLMITNMLEGCDVVLGEDYFAHKEDHDILAQHVLYTGPIDRYFDYQWDVLPYRALHWESERRDGYVTQGAPVILNTGPDGTHTRTIEHKYFNMMDETNIISKNILTKEYAEEWNIKSEYEPCYPVYTQLSREIYSAYKTFADADRKVVFGGRLATFTNPTMAETIKNAMDLVEKVKD